LRVLLTSHQFPPKHSYGTEKLTFECGRELLSRGHEVYVLTSEAVSSYLPQNQYWDYAYHGLKVRLFGLSLGETPDPLRYEFDNPQMAENMREYLREVRPDIVHVWHAGRLSGSIIAAAKELGVPVVFTATDFWSVCRVVHLRRADTGKLCEGPNRAGTNCLRCYIARTNAPQAAKDKYLRKSDAQLAIYTTLANSPLLKNTKYGKRIRMVTKRNRFLKDVVNSTDKVIAPTKLTHDLLLRNGIDSRLLRVSRYGIETSHITAAPPSPAHPSVVRFGFMGGLIRHKGVHTLIRAFRDIPEAMPAELKIYGALRRNPQDPAYFDELKQLSSGDRRISFVGSFEGEKVGWILSEVDVLVVPSAWYENTPLVIYEAFASGTPVVATDLGGLSEVVEHGRNGLLFGVDDARDLNAQLMRFLSEPDLISTLREGIGPVRTVGDSVDELGQIYEEVLGSRNLAARAG
jgi:glycosyltransferase involved in cell wall biosynthesis